MIDARKEKTTSLIDSFNAYENLMKKMTKAIQFYQKLNNNVMDLQKKVKHALDEKEKEKDAVFAKLAAPKATAPPAMPAAAASSRPTLKDYLNAGATANMVRPNMPMPTPAYIPPNPMMYHQQPPPPRPPPTTQGYQHPGMMNLGYPSAPGPGVSMTPNQGYHPATSMPYQGYHPMYPGHQPMPGQQQPAPPPSYSQQQEPINPNDLSLI